MEFNVFMSLPDVLILSGAGVGGGSLVYANTLYQPGDDYFNDKQLGFNY
jgi:cholesterol oxidase